jgi:hypothetical protein
MGLVVFSALQRTVNLSGRTVIEWRAGEATPFFQGFRPSARVREVGEWVELRGDPVYASVTPPGNYDTVEVALEFRPQGQPIMEVGGTVQAESGAIDLRPFYHATLEGLSWKWVEEQGVRLWQRVPGAASVEAWLASPVDRAHVAVYRASLPANTHPPAAWTQGGGRVLDSVSLRGRHLFYTVSDGRPVRVEALVMDMNRNPGADPVRIVISQAGKVVGEASLPDDGVDRATQVAVERRSLAAQAAVEPGLVEVELLGSSDVYWRRLALSTPKLTFALPVYLGDDVGFLDGVRGVKWWTNAQTLTAHTMHAAALQTITVDHGAPIVLSTPHERVAWNRAVSDVVAMAAPKGDVFLAGDGLLAFSPDAFVNAVPRSVPLQGGLTTDTDAVLARYTPVEELEDGWVRTRVSFSLATLEREEVEDTATRREQAPTRFVISLPGIVERSGVVQVRAAQFTFTRPAQPFFRGWKNALAL